MRIIVADHHINTLRALAMVIQEMTEYELIGEVLSAEDLLKLAKTSSVDLILMDWDLPGLAVDDLIAELHSLEWSPAVVVMGSHDEYGRRAFKAGANAFVSKGDQSKWLLDTLQRYATRTQR